MWSKDLIAEMLELLRNLPERIGEVVKREPSNSTADRPRSPSRGAGREAGEWSKLSKEVEGIFGNLGRLVPGLGGLASTLRNLRNAIEGINNLGGIGAVAPSRQADVARQARPLGHPTEAYTSGRQRWNDTLLRAAAQSAKVASEGLKARERWVQTVLGAKARQGAAEATSSPRPFAESGSGAYRFPDADEILRARREASRQSRPPTPDLGSEFLKSFYSGKPVRPGWAHDVTKAAGSFAKSEVGNILSDVSPATIRRYNTFGSLGQQDKVGRLFDRHPLIRDLLAGSVNGLAQAGVHRLLLGGGGAGKGGGGGVGAGAGGADFFPLVPRSVGALTRTKFLPAVLGETLPAMRTARGWTRTVLDAEILGVARLAGGGARALLPLAGGAARAGLGAAGMGTAGALGIAGGAVAAAAAAAVAVGVGLTVLPPKIAALSESVVNAQRRLAGVHPGMAATFAEFDVRQIYRERRLADLTVRTTRLLAKETADLQDQLTPQKGFFTNLGNMWQSWKTGWGQAGASITSPVFDALNHAIDFDKAGFVLNQTNRGMGALAKGFLYGNMPGAMGEFGLQFLKDFKNFQAGNYDTTAWGAWMTKISQDAINLPLRPAGFVP